MSGKEKNTNVNAFLRYSSIGVQMGITIYLASLLGKWLDEKYLMSNELFFKTITISSVFLSIYRLVVQLNKMGER